MNESEAGASRARFFPFRLIPGEELVTGLRTVVRFHDIRAGYIAGAVGSVSKACLRFAGESCGRELQGCFEVVSLVGTVDTEGEHLHMILSDSNGHVLGGHVLEGCVVRTTMELILGELERFEFTREYCPASTYRELAVHHRRK